MNKLPVLKEFLLEGDAENYENIQIEYRMGLKPTMTIYHDGNMHETISLESFHSKAALHNLFKDKGFVLKSQEDQEKQRNQRQREKEFRKQQKEERGSLMEEKRKLRELQMEAAILRQKDRFGFSSLEQRRQREEKQENIRRMKALSSDYSAPDDPRKREMEIRDKLRAQRQSSEAFKSHEAKKLEERRRKLEEKRKKHIDQRDESKESLLTTSTIQVEL